MIKRAETLHDLLKRAAVFDKLTVAEKSSWFQEQANSLMSEGMSVSRKRHRDRERCQTDAAIVSIPRQSRGL